MVHIIDATFNSKMKEYSTLMSGDEKTMDCIGEKTISFYRNRWAYTNLVSIEKVHFQRILYLYCPRFYRTSILSFKNIRSSNFSGRQFNLVYFVVLLRPY